MTDKNYIDAFELNDIGDVTGKKLKEVANYPYGRMVKVMLSGGDLENVKPLTAGTLITLDANVEHEVTANPDLSLLVTKFKQY